ncbi:MAG TPA: energy transducer TonB [Rhizomicrobium sp.]|nr:energy transducer TonB [Rhizomicrobium sp.]
MKRLAVLLLMLPTIAWAQAAPPAPPPVKPPGALGSHTCAQQYPREATRLGQEGDNTVSFHITADGSVTNVTVTQSSGIDVLDQAAITCVSGWLYKPATQNGQPVEVPWQAKVSWRVAGFKPESIPANAIISPVAIGLPHVCRDYQRSSSSEYILPPGTALLAFNIETDGSVKNAVVQRSSGDARFDKYAQRCVGAWQFRPAMQNGQPVEMNWVEKVAWQQ